MRAILVFLTTREAAWYGGI